MRERMDLSPRCPQCGGPVVNSTHYLGRTEHPLVRECENGHAWDALDNVTMLDANGAALVTKDQTPPSIVPTDDELLTYRGRGFDGSRNSPGGYMGCGTLEEHCLQVRDPKSWVQSALPRWRDQALLLMAHPSVVGEEWGPLQIFDESGKERRFTAEPCGPLEMLVMSLARELHDAEHADCDWFGHVGSTISSFCRRACEARGLDWKWVLQAIERERLDERTEAR